MSSLRGNVSKSIPELYVEPPCRLMKAAVHKEKSVHKSEELIVFLRRTVISCLHACDE